MTLPTETYDEGKQALLAAMRCWERQPTDPWFSEWLADAQRAGWRRRHVVDLLWDVVRNHPNDLAERTIDELGEHLTGLTGYCAPECIVRFIGDPTGRDELTAHVRGDRWKSDDGEN